MIRKLFRKYREIIVYAIFGAATTLVNLAAYALLQKLFPGELTDAQLSFCNVVALIVSIAFAFVTNKLFVFESKSWKPSVALREAATFAGSRALSAAVEIAGFPLLLKAGLDGKLLGVEGFWAKAIVTVVVIVMNYVLSKLLVFRKDKTHQDQ